jgi:N-acetyltransferase 10
LVLEQKNGANKSTTVSIKTGKDKKRKAGDAVTEAYKEADSLKEGGKKKKSKFGKSKG